MSSVRYQCNTKRMMTRESDSESSVSCDGITRPTKRRKRRHIPHSQRPTEFVDKRNGRERKRVDDLNSAFESLKHRVPFIPRRTVRTSKMKILTNAISYIQHLSALLHDAELPSQSHGQPDSVTSLCPASGSPAFSPANFLCHSEIEFVEDRIPPILMEGPVEGGEFAFCHQESQCVVIGGGIPDDIRSPPSSITDSDAGVQSSCSDHYICDPLLTTLSLMSRELDVREGRVRPPLHPRAQSQHWDVE